MAKDLVYEGKREVRTYFELAYGADVLIEKTEQDQKESTYTTMGSLLLTAFTFEAYLIHLGAEKVEFWDEIERISVKKKYSVLCKLFGINPDHSRRPYRTVKKLFWFRNLMAHGRTELCTVKKELNSKDGGDAYEHRAKAKWEEYCTLENAKRAIEDVDKIITKLNKSAGLGHPYVGGLWSATITSKKPNK